MAKLVCNFYSYVLNRAYDITVVLPSVTCPESLGLADYPASHELKERFPLLYLLHGFGNNHAQWTGYTNIEMYAEERRIAVVNISAENKAYAHVGGDDFMKFLSVSSAFYCFHHKVFCCNERKIIVTCFFYDFFVYV